MLKILDARDLHPAEEQRARVAASTDLGQLEPWFDRSLTVATATDVFNDSTSICWASEDLGALDGG